MMAGIEFSGSGKYSASRLFSRKRHMFIIITAIVVGFIIGILIGRFAACDESSSSSQSAEKVKPNGDGDADPDVAALLMNAIDNRYIENNLRRLTAKPHLTGQQADTEVMTYIKDTLKGYGVDSVRAAPYEVLLSYPGSQMPDSLQLLDSSGQLVFDTLTSESTVSYDQGVVPPFLGFSPAKEITADMIYVNYGRVEDFDYLTNKSINVTGKIVIARYGKIFRGSKVEIATSRGAAGVILYSDPEDYTWPQEDSRVYPDTIWLPPSAVQRGHGYIGEGDVLSPGYPAIRTAYRYPKNSTEVKLPKIPAIPIGYGNAVHFLQALQGQEVPEGWRGGLNITYRHGPLTSGQVRMNVTTTSSVRRIHNVIAIIRGQVEPDRYVLVGNHYDAWVYGAIDPNSGTAVLLEVARAMTQLVTQGKWRPRRSIMFCFWGAEEQGLIGSTEWADQYVKSLGPRAVAYLNMDIAVQGNYSLRAKAAPLLYQTLFDATKKVPNPNAKEVSEGRPTVYDTWKHSFPWDDYDLPRVKFLGSGSDFAPLLQRVGITSLDFRYTYDSNKYKSGSYPLYHTQYETFDMVKTLLDQDFKYHQAVGRVAGEMLRSLADTVIIPFNVSDYTWGLELGRRQLHADYGSLMSQRIGNYADLERIISAFGEDVVKFEKTVASINRTDPMAVRMVNDQLVMLEKAFLDSSGLPDRPFKKHLIFAESSKDLYASSSFPGLRDLMFEIEDLPPAEQTERWEQVRHHFSVILNVIQSAGYTLRDVTDFVEEQY